MYLKLPRYVKQALKWSCWAAALESWMEVTGHPDKMNQANLCSAYSFSASTGALDMASSATSAYSFNNLVEEMQLGYKKMHGEDLTLDYVQERLKNKGHLLLAYNLSTSAAHANVVYGIGYPTGKGRLISVMDPAEVTRDPLSGVYRNRPLSYYSKRSVVLVAWKK